MLQTVTGAIEMAAKISGAVKGSESLKMLNNRSLIDVASVARVEPIMMIDADCMNLPCLSDIMQAMHSMFAGYYLQAVNMVNTIGEVSVGERLAAFNPNAGSGMGFESYRVDAKRAYSMQEYKHRLPRKGDRKLSMEDYQPGKKDANVEMIQDASSLSVGKTFTITLQGDGQCTNVPVAIRLMCHTVPSRTMVNLFSNTDSFDMDMSERYHSWKSGRISFWKDLVLCNDLIDKRIKSSITDTSGILSMVRGRQSGNNVQAAINSKASVANATNLAVVSTETMAAVEADQGGAFKNSKVRNAVFESSNLMIIGVVDKQWEIVTFYFRGMAASTSMSYKELKVAGKNDGSNVTDILKAYISGAAPQP